jgi:hypothetical protein
MPELPGSPLVYVGREGSAASTGFGVGAALDGSPALAPASGPPKIFVRSPTVEFLDLASIALALRVGRRAVKKSRGGRRWQPERFAARGNHR